MLFSVLPCNLTLSSAAQRQALIRSFRDYLTRMALAYQSAVSKHETVVKKPHKGHPESVEVGLCVHIEAGADCFRGNRLLTLFSAHG